MSQKLLHHFFTLVRLHHIATVIAVGISDNHGKSVRLGLSQHFLAGHAIHNILATGRTGSKGDALTQHLVMDNIADKPASASIANMILVIVVERTILADCKLGVQSFIDNSGDLFDLVDNLAAGLTNLTQVLRTSYYN